jgi:hypothetical protein
MLSPADTLLAQARTMTETAIEALKLRSGNPTTQVLPGYPYTVVSTKSANPSSGAAVESDLITTYHKFFPPNKVQFFPGDHTVTANGARCYSRKPPKFEVPKNTRQFFFLKTIAVVQSEIACSGATPILSPKSLRVVSADIQMSDTIPTEVIPTGVTNPCGGSPLSGTSIQLPGTYTFYSPLLVAAPTGPKTLVLRGLNESFYKKGDSGEDVGERTYYQTKNPVSRQLASFGRLEQNPKFALSGGGYATQSNMSVVRVSVVDAP